MKSRTRIKVCVCAAAALFSVILQTNVWASPGAMIEEVESSSANKVMPKLLSQTPPTYPQSLARSGTEGVVTVAFTVDEMGRVTDPQVMASTARQLDAYALKSIVQWKFSPGEKDGKIASFRLKVPIEFPPKGMEKSADAGSALPDTAISQPAAKRKVAPVYPYEMLVQGKDGWADASFLIDYTGRPLFTNPAGSSNSAFAKSIVAMIEASEYVPNRKDKKPAMISATQHYQFEGESALDAGARRVLAELRKPNPRIYGTSELDERPKALRQDAPVYPRALKDDGLTGQAEIEFVVDRDGRVLFPRIVSATHEDFGWAAATAVSQWRFQPPQKNGQAVEARITMPVLFDARKLAASD